MRVACLFDIHGNLPALEAVLADVRASRADRIVVGGDVLPGPMPRECLDLLNSLDIPCDYIIGNGDRATRQARHGTMDPLVPAFFHEAMNWNAAQLTDADDRAIEQWPLTLELNVDGIGRVLFCHATPRNDNEIFVKTTSDDKLRPIFDSLGMQLVVCGHTHMQFDRVVGRTRIVNAGSVGMPFQDAGAYWALLGPDVKLRRTSYDFNQAAARIRTTGYPQAEWAAAGILQPFAEQTMVEQFSKAELGSS
jgi:predicted phosphodiesterase